MQTLRDVQFEFAKVIFSRNDSGVPRWIMDDGLEPGQRLEIYRGNVFGCLTDALKMAYPVIYKLVGSNFFEYLASSYIRGHPSTSGDLHAFGGELAEFLKELPETRKLTYLPDVARLEWACHLVFFAADHPPLLANRLASLPEDRYGELQFHLHPATGLIESEFPIHLIWESNQEGFSGDPAVDLDCGGVSILVKRRDYQAALQPMSRGEWSFLNACFSGKNFAEADQTALQADSEFDVAASLKQFVSDSIVVDFST